MIGVKEAEIQYDCDGVFIYTYPPLLEKMNELARNLGLPGSWTINDFVTYDWMDNTFRDVLGITNPTEIWTPDLLMAAKPSPYAIEVLAHLDKKHQGRINFATARRPYLQATTIAWFEQYYPKPLKEGRLYMADGNGGPAGDEFKRYILELSGAKRVYDDSGKTALALGEKARLVDRPYNREPEYQHITRIYDGWPGIAAHEAMCLADRS